MTMKKALVQIACAGVTVLAASLARGGTVAYWPMVMDPATGGTSRKIADVSGNNYTLNVKLSDAQVVNTSEGAFSRPPNGPAEVTASSCVEIKKRSGLKAWSSAATGQNPGLRPRVLVYRFPNLFGKWCRPNYNSAVATFCNAIANDLPYTVNDPSVELELLYIDDLVDEMIACLRGEEHRCEFDGLGVFPMKDGRYCYVPTTHHATLGEIVDLLNQFAAQPQTLLIPEIPAGSFAKKLYSTYLSYLPKEKVAFPLKMNVDNRGSFTELVHTLNAGQVSINISKPGITKGQHWHNTKWEFFIVVAGHGLIQERKLGTDEVIEFEVSGDNIQAVHMLPGYTHNIINLSETENLVTVMYCNEIFDPNRPDTYFEPVK